MSETVSSGSDEGEKIYMLRSRPVRCSPVIPQRRMTSRPRPKKGSKSSAEQPQPYFRSRPKKKSKSSDEQPPPDPKPKFRFFPDVSEEEMAKYVKEMLGDRPHLPPPRRSKEERAESYRGQCQKWADFGVNYLNNPHIGDTEYELVKPSFINFFLTDKGGVYHVNFEAKAKNEAQAEVELFFLEVVARVPGDDRVTTCVSLGISDSPSCVKGFNGCKMCSKVHHPGNGGFTTC